MGAESAEGRVVDERGEPLEGLVALAAEASGEADGIALVESRTDADGRFRLEWTRPVPVGPVMVVVADRENLVRLVRVVSRGVDAKLGSVVVARAALDGFTVRLGGAEPSRLTRGNRVALLADDEAMADVLASVRGAREDVRLAQFLFSSGFVAAWEPAPARLADELVLADARGASVRVLLSENAIAPDDVDELAHHLRSAGAVRSEVRGLRLSPDVLHAKVLVVDHRVAHVIGPPFWPKFWDSRAHDPLDVRRDARQPFHDTTVRVEGPAVADLSDLFAALWSARREEAPLPRAPRPRPAGPLTMQVVRTVPPGLLADAPDGERGPLEAYLRAFRGATRLLYLENQYFTNGLIADALGRTLRAKPDLECVLVVNLRPDVPGYPAIQAARLDALLALPNLRVFTLAVPDPSRGASAPLYTHAKIAIADDRFATVGAANMDGISLIASLEFGVPIRPNVEANVVLLDGADGEPATGDVARVRARVWAEHLGHPADELVRAPKAGWLAFWERAAEANEAALAAGRDPRGRAVPYASKD